MDQEILNFYSRINYLNVSRETFLDFENYISMILEKNKKINVISQNTSSKKAIIDRHIIDSAQIIDFVDLNSNTTTDIGSGGGMPGIIVAIMLKNMKNNMNVHLYEKSYHKSHFLKEVSEKLNLNTKIFQKNIFEPFVSSKKSSKGGLGLAMVAKIINDHNGIISFETNSEGTIFTINLASAG